MAAARRGRRPLRGIAAADVVVGTGRAAVEALVMGRRVVVAKTLHDDAAADENFGWRSRPALAPAAVWRALEAVTADEVAAVRDRAREELSAQRMLARELELLATLEPAPAGASGALAHAEALADARWGGARRLPRPLDRPDRAVLLLRDHGRPGW